MPNTRAQWFVRVPPLFDSESDGVVGGLEIHMRSRKNKWGSEIELGQSGRMNNEGHFPSDCAPTYCCWIEIRSQSNMTIYPLAQTDYNCAPTSNNYPNKLFSFPFHPRHQFSRSPIRLTSNCRLRRCYIVCGCARFVAPLATSPTTTETKVISCGSLLFGSHFCLSQIWLFFLFKLTDGRPGRNYTNPNYPIINIKLNSLSLQSLDISCSKLPKKVWRTPLKSLIMAKPLFQ